MYFIQKRSFIFWILLCLYTCVYAQVEIQPLSDSLEGKSYRYLYTQFDKNAYDTLISKIYLKAYLNKATLEKDFKNKSLALNILSGYETDDHEKLSLIQQSIKESNRAKGDSLYSIAPYNSLGLYYLKKYEYENALKQFLKVSRLSIKNNNKSSEIMALTNIAFIKADIGNHKDALQLFRKCFFLEKTKDKIDNYALMESSLFLSESLRYNRQYDSATYYYATIIDTLRKKSDFLLGRALINEGVNLYHKNDTIKAKALLLEGMSKAVSKSKYDILAHFYLGKILQKNNQEKGIQYFLKVDSLITAHNLVLPEFKDVYTSLITYYEETNDNQKQLLFLDKLAKFNELTASRTIEVSEEINAKFDIPQILKSRNELIKSLQTKNDNLTIEKIFLLSLLVIVIIFFVVHYRKQKKYRKRFEKIIDQIQLEDMSSMDVVEMDTMPKLNIDPKTVEEILDKLQMFESKNGFLKNTVTITSLARKLSTNTKYLSKVINTYKNKSFIAYINDLRIDYVLEELHYNQVFQRYTIAGIAQEIGFNSADSFSSAFKKKTGITPSYYIKNIKKRNPVFQ